MSGHEADLPDFYDLLECDDHADDKALQKAFRRQAIKYHPDKNPTQEAAERFHLLTIALDNLTDFEKRKKYDAARRQKQEAARRREQIEGDRKAWILELEKGESAASMSENDRKRKRQQEESREEELSRTGARLRAELAASMKMRTEEKPFAFKSQTNTNQRNPKVDSGIEEERMFTSEQKTLKIRLRSSSTEQQLRTIFSHFGKVNEVVYRANDKGKHFALIEYDQIHGAYNATQACAVGKQNGADIRSVTWAFWQGPDFALAGTESHATAPGSGVTPGSTSKPGNDSNVQHHKAKSNADTRADKPVPQSIQAGGDVESLILLRMKQRQREKECLQSSAAAEAHKG